MKPPLLPETMTMKYSHRTKEDNLALYLLPVLTCLVYNDCLYFASDQNGC